jgi:hypothetical protein
MRDILRIPAILVAGAALASTAPLAAAAAPKPASTASRSFSLAPGATPGAAVDPAAAIVRDEVSGRCRTKPTEVGAVARKTLPCASGQGG